MADKLLSNVAVIHGPDRFMLSSSYFSPGDDIMKSVYAEFRTESGKIVRVKVTAMKMLDGESVHCNIYGTGHNGKSVVIAAYDLEARSCPRGYGLTESEPTDLRRTTMSARPVQTSK